MAKRTYLPALVLIVQTLCNYITRWNNKIRDNMDTGQRVALDAAEVACHALLIAIGTLPTGD